MTTVRFVRSDGSFDCEVDVAPGSNLLDVAQASGQPLEGTCEKQMSCSTCHVILSAEDFARLPPACDDEDYLLDLAHDAQPTSRLACQVTVTGEKMTVRIP